MATFDINDTNRRVQYTTNGSTTSFAFSFQINAASELKVILAEATQELSTHYTVTIATDGTGTVNYSSAPTTGQKLTILANKPLSRESAYSTGASFTAASLETDFDNTIMVLQQFEEKIDRTLQLPEFVTGSTPPSLIVPYNDTVSNNINKVIGYDSNGTALTLLKRGIDSVTVNASTVSAGGSATGSATLSGDDLTLALGIPTGATGATGALGANPQLSMTFNNSTSDADPGAGKIAFNNGTLSSVSVLFIDDADDAGADITTFVQSFDDVTNAVARGIITITKESAPATYATYKVTGAITDASGYTKVAVTHLTSSGSFSNLDGVSVHFSYSGADGSGDITGVTAGTNLSGGGTSGTVTLNLADASTSAKGAASFSSDNFAVSSGAVTIKDAGVALAKLSATGTKNSSTFLRGDNTFAEAGGGGKVLQVISAAVAKATFTSAIPDDDTTPTVSEGTEIYSQAITPSATSSKILITGSIEGSSSAANGWGITVFRGSTCILTVHQTNAMGGTQPCQCNINVLDSPSSSSAVTYSVRAGCMAGSSAIFIQRRGTEKYNNTMALNSVTLQEIGA